MVYKTPHRKPSTKNGVKLGAPERLAAPAPLVTPVVLLLLQTQ